MKSVYKYRSYFKAVFFSVLVAFTIDAAINFDDLGKKINNGRAKAEEIAHADSLLSIPKKAGAICTSLLKMFFIQN